MKRLFGKLWAIGVSCFLAAFSMLGVKAADPQTNVYIQNYLYPSSSYTAVSPVDYVYYIRNARDLN